MDDHIESLAKLMFQSRHLVVFTGAGISTESGLPDFRGPDGLWTRRDKGLPPPVSSRPWHLVDPNPGHYAITELQNMGKLAFLISQNVDNLHLKSGIRQELLAELHGNMTKLRCKRCGRTYDKERAPRVCFCGGPLRSATVDFGEALPEEDLRRALEHSRKADLFIVVGSSLVVTPAADMPAEALRVGAKLVIINQGETPFDRYASLRFFEPIGAVLPPAVERLKVLLQQK